MEEKERDDLASILREAQEIVEDAIGAIGSSMVKDQMVLSLAGALVHRYWSQEKKSKPDLPFPFGFGEGSKDKASEIAFRLLSEIKFCRNKAQDPKWVWRTYLYFLKQARKEQAKGSERVLDDHNEG